MHDMGSLGHTLQIDLPMRLGEPRPVPGRVEGDGQTVLSCDQCFLLFQVFLSSFLPFVVGGLGFEFCVFVACWRQEACSSE